jgi:hypothetical protein
MEEQFFNDNLFIFDKASWRSIKDRKIILTSKSVIINIYDANKKKWNRKSGTKIHLKVWKYLMEFERTSILDTIDIYRANDKYLNLLKKFGIDQRISKLRDCMSIIDKSFEVVKKVVKTRFIGSLKHHRVTKELMNGKNNVLTVRDN